MNPNVTAVTLLILSVALFFTVADVNNQKVNALKDKSEEYDRAMQQSIKLLKKRDELLEKYNNISPDDLAKLKKMVPGNIDNVRLILELMKLSNEFGVNVSNIQITAEAAKEQNPTSKNSQNQISSGQKYNSAVVNFSFTTTYGNFMTYVRGLQNNLRLMDVTRITFGSGPDDKYNFNITLKTYWLPE